MLGIAGLERIPFSPWLQLLLIAVMLMNLVSVWLRANTFRRLAGFYLACVGAVLILVSKGIHGSPSIAYCGLALSWGGSIASVLRPPLPNFCDQENKGSIN
jgi:hypothetical protein